MVNSNGGFDKYTGLSVNAIQDMLEEEIKKELVDRGLAAISGCQTFKVSIQNTL